VLIETDPDLKCTLPIGPLLKLKVLTFLRLGKFCNNSRGEIAGRFVVEFKRVCLRYLCKSNERNKN
jgi:hypothetical protein